jgi:hypothetical protein
VHTLINSPAQLVQPSLRRAELCRLCFDRAMLHGKRIPPNISFRRLAYLPYGRHRSFIDLSGRDWFWRSPAEALPGAHILRESSDLEGHGLSLDVPSLRDSPYKPGWQMLSVESHGRHSPMEAAPFQNRVLTQTLNSMHVLSSISAVLKYCSPGRKCVTAQKPLDTFPYENILKEWQERQQRQMFLTPSRSPGGGS